MTPARRRPEMNRPAPRTTMTLSSLHYDERNGPLMSRRRNRLIVAVAALALVLTLAPASLAGGNGGGRGGGGGGGTTSGGSVTLVLLDSTDGVAHWGQAVTFKVTT